jgi:hypothetical protein
MLSLAFLGIESVTKKLGIDFISGIAGFLRRNIFRVEAIAAIGLAITGVMAAFGNPAAMALCTNMMSAFAPATIARNLGNGHNILTYAGSVYGGAITNGWNGMFNALGAFFGAFFKGVETGVGSAMVSTNALTTTPSATAATNIAFNAATPTTTGIFTAIPYTNVAHSALEIIPTPPPTDHNTFAAMCQIAQSKCLGM